MREADLGPEGVELAARSLAATVRTVVSETLRDIFADASVCLGFFG
jgi:hypothetical protein